MLILHRGADSCMPHHIHDGKQIFRCAVHLGSKAMTGAVENEILRQSCCLSRLTKLSRHRCEMTAFRPVPLENPERSEPTRIILLSEFYLSMLTSLLALLI